MICIHTASASAEARLLKQLLEGDGLSVLIKGESLDTLRGEIPIPEAMPTVWVLRDEDEARAREIVAAYLEGPARAASSEGWTCPGCGESLEAQFGACWSCGAERP